MIRSTVHNSVSNIIIILKRKILFEQIVQRIGNGHISYAFDCTYSAAYSATNRISLQHIQDTPSSYLNNQSKETAYVIH